MDPARTRWHRPRYFVHPQQRLDLEAAESGRQRLYAKSVRSVKVDGDPGPAVAQTPGVVEIPSAVAGFPKTGPRPRWRTGYSRRLRCRPAPEPNHRNASIALPAGKGANRSGILSDKIEASASSSGTTR